jgi:hypothetical protein
MNFELFRLVLSATWLQRCVPRLGFLIDHHGSGAARRFRARTSWPDSRTRWPSSKERGEVPSASAVAQSIPSAFLNRLAAIFHEARVNVLCGLKVDPEAVVSLRPSFAQNCSVSTPVWPRRSDH